MRSYYRPDYDAHQASYHRTRRCRTFLALAKRGAVVLALGGIVTLAAAAWTSRCSLRRTRTACGPTPTS